MWEYYKTLILYEDHKDLTDQLNKLGSDNWEIIYYKELPKQQFALRSQVEILLKRPNIIDLSDN